MSFYEYTVGLSQIPDVVAHLKFRGRNASFAVFTFDTQVVIEGQSDNTLNLQYEIVNGIVGLEWPLCRQRNIADKQQLIKYISKRGYKITERVQKFTGHEFDDVHYLRVEEGDITDLGICIVSEFYKLRKNAEIDLLTNGFERRCLKMADVIHFVQLPARQQGFIGDVERISAVLRMIHGGTTCDFAFAEFKTLNGFVRFTDVVDDKLHHSFYSEIKAEPRTQKLEVEILGENGINLLSACGYHRIYSKENNYENWFSAASDKDFRKLAELCVGILHLLFGHVPGHPLEVNFFMPGPDLDRLPKWEDLPESLQAPYGTFKADFYNAMAQYHRMMAIESPSLTNSQRGDLLETSEKMKNSMKEFPSWIRKLKKLGAAYANFYSCAIDNQTELIESLTDLHRRYKIQIFH